MILQKQIVHNQKQKDNDRKNKQTFRIILAELVYQILPARSERSGIYIAQIQQ